MQKITRSCLDSTSPLSTAGQADHSPNYRWPSAGCYSPCSCQGTGCVVAGRLASLDPFAGALGVFVGCKEIHWSVILMDNSLISLGSWGSGLIGTRGNQLDLGKRMRTRGRRWVGGWRRVSGTGSGRDCWLRSCVAARFFMGWAVCPAYNFSFYEYTVYCMHA